MSPEKRAALRAGATGKHGDLAEAILELLDERDRLAARVLYLEAPGECQSLHKLRAECDAERADAVAWLRASGTDWRADAIERGEHRRTP